jgi:two-component system cell cycle sensor histidine kinase/response regulator CckA
MTETSQRTEPVARCPVEKRHALHKPFLTTSVPSSIRQWKRHVVGNLVTVGRAAFRRHRTLQLATQALAATLDLDEVLYRDRELALLNRIIAASAAGQEIESILGTLVEQAAEAVVIADTQGCALYVNRAFERISGLSQADVLGCGPATWLGQQTVDRSYTSLWLGATASRPWQSRLTNARPDGTSYTVDLTVTPLRNDSEGIANYVATLRDVTREVQLEEQFHQAQKMEALGQLAGGIAHDFNNLLTVIRLSTQLLHRRIRPEDPLREHIVRIEETGARASKLTNQLLRFSRREIVEPTPVDLTELVGELESMLQRIIGENIQLQTHLAEDLWQVHADPSQIDQVILNLIVNARDAMPQGGSLTIRTSNVVLDRDYAASHVDAEPGEYVLLSISDTGVGMDEGVRAHLFEPFFTTKEPGQGTGLGLATVFGIVRQNRGHIRVHSQVGGGTTFNLYLPRATEAEGIEPPRLPSSVPSRLTRGSETILVVEDKADVRSLAVDVLQSCGYHVLVAEDGLHALEVSRQYDGPIHLLLTDVVMPYLDGTELAKKLAVERPEARMLFISGYADHTLLDRDRPEGGITLLPKPFTVEELTQKAREALDHKR